MATDRLTHPLSGRTALVAEDSDLQRAHAVDLLKLLGAETILEATDGEEALACFLKQPGIDLLLCDLDMPRMDGVRLVGELAARGHRPELVIASALERDVLHTVRLMAETYGLPVAGSLGKPLNLGELGRIFTRIAPKQSGRHVLEKPELPSAEDIRRGILNREFRWYFQPQLTLRGALFKGVEALVRWKHPTHGLLGPAAFLPRAEEDEDLITQLTLAMLEQVAPQWAAWKEKGLSLAVSANISSLSLSAPRFADQLLDATKRLDLPPSHLLFEVTESASVSDLGHTLENLARIRIHGYKLSIDDFGSGFASLQQLQRIPFTELKLDCSITKDLGTSKRQVALARNILRMAQDLHLATVAEGVEDMNQWILLRELGCELAQGYLIARPMPGEEIGDWASQDRTRLRVGTT